MSEPLFPDVLECGCARGLGHSCRVPWMTIEEWFTGAAYDRGATQNGVESSEIGGDRMVREHHPIPSPPIHLEGGDA